MTENEAAAAMNTTSSKLFQSILSRSKAAA